MIADVLRLRPQRSGSRATADMLIGAMYGVCRARVSLRILLVPHQRIAVQRANA